MPRQLLLVETVAATSNNLFKVQEHTSSKAEQMAKQGVVTYTDRAFEQDADLAMGGDVIRGLVELITNCDDAYGSGDGKITVTLIHSEHDPLAISVSDNGPGLSPQGLQDCFTELGGKKSGFHKGDDVRGLFGRGAKDTAAFGRTRFESIKDGTYGILELNRNGTWNSDEHAATQEDFAQLEISENDSGLVATMLIEKNPHTVPNFNRLSDHLERHVQLRKLNGIREVIVRERRPDKPLKSKVVRWTPPSGTVVFSDEIKIPGFDTTATVELLKLASPSEGVCSVYSKHGIEIRGKRAVYTNSLFGSTGPETLWIHGSITCLGIDDLLRSYDEESNNDELNPTRLIRRDRNGLSEDHPFTIALNKAVLGVLDPILSDLKPKTDTATGGEKLKKDLERASNALSALIRNDLANIDEPEGPGGDRPHPSAPIIIIPPRVGVRVGKRRTMTVLVSKKKISNPETLIVTSSNSSIVTVEQLGEFKDHASFEETSISNFRIDATAFGNVVITVTDSVTSSSSSAEIRVHDDDGPDEEPPETLEWSNAKMSVSLGKERSVTLSAPIEMAPTGQLVCEVSIEGNGIELLDHRIELRANSKGWLTGTCKIVGRKADSIARITATDGKNDAIGEIRVARPSGFDGLGIEVKVVDQFQGRLRGSMIETDTGNRIEVYAKHPALTTLIGVPDSEGSFANEENLEVRLILTEIISSTIADWLVGKEAEKYAAELKDAASVLARRNFLVDRYITPLQRALATP
jgi:hypothetical protein